MPRTARIVPEDAVYHILIRGNKSIIVSKDDYLLACGSYVELNPVRAGIVEDPREYRRSSYGVYGYGKKDGLVDEHQIYLNLSEDEGEKRKRYREFGRKREV